MSRSHNGVLYDHRLRTGDRANAISTGRAWLTDETGVVLCEVRATRMALAVVVACKRRRLYT